MVGCREEAYWELTQTIVHIFISFNANKNMAVNLLLRSHQMIPINVNHWDHHKHSVTETAAQK